MEVLNVLVADDNRHMHSIVNAILNARRIKDIRFCDNAADAFLEMRQWVPDIIITDWKMEPLDGHPIPGLSDGRATPTATRSRSARAKRPEPAPLEDHLVACHRADQISADGDAVSETTT